MIEIVSEIVIVDSDFKTSSVEVLFLLRTSVFIWITIFEGTVAFFFVSSLELGLNFLCVQFFFSLQGSLLLWPTSIHFRNSFSRSPALWVNYVEKVFIIYNNCSNFSIFMFFIQFLWNICVRICNCVWLDDDLFG